MKYVIGIIIGIVCLAGVIALKAISASTTYMYDSFPMVRTRWVLKMIVEEMQRDIQTRLPMKR